MNAREIALAEVGADRAQLVDARGADAVGEAGKDVHGCPRVVDAGAGLHVTKLQSTRFVYFRAKFFWRGGGGALRPLTTENLSD